MAIPRVFISSTCYDLKHIRESLKYFVRSVGYEPVLSDDGDVFYSHLTHTHDACLGEVGACQMFVLIIGGRYGGAYKGTTKSITNHEYIEASRRGIPVFTLIESGVHSDHHVFNTNKSTSGVDEELIVYPSSDSTRIFSFIDEVRKASVNNAIFPFKNYSEIESYLKKQWAGMMFNFLRESSDKVGHLEVVRLVESLSLATRKTEELLKLLVAAPNINVSTVEVQEVVSKVEAGAFASSVGSVFQIYDQIDIDPIDFDIRAIPESWIDFLLLLPGFKMEQCDFDEEDQTCSNVLFGPGDVGIDVSYEYLSGETISATNDYCLKLQAAYDSFYRASEEVKRYVLSRFASGDWRA